MTKEEMAEEYVKENTPLFNALGKEMTYTYKYMKQAYLAGLKAGRSEWHKVSEQIPTEEKEYLVKLTDGTVDVMTIALDGDLEPYLLTPKFDFYKDVEKWCEIPPEE
jgi:hypothetical protein